MNEGSPVVREESTWMALAICPCTLLIRTARVPTPFVATVVGFEIIRLTVGFGQGDPFTIAAWLEVRAIGRHDCLMRCRRSKTTVIRKVGEDELSPI